MSNGIEAKKAKAAILDTMKERVEAAFMTKEDSSCDDSLGGAMSEDNNTNDTYDFKEDEAKAPPPGSRDRRYPSAPSSEESSNDGQDVQTNNKSKSIKNAILRNCFASIHRRQQKEKEEEISLLLNGVKHD